MWVLVLSYTWLLLYPFKTVLVEIVKCKCEQIQFTEHFGLITFLKLHCVHANAISKLCFNDFLNFSKKKKTLGLNSSTFYAHFFLPISLHQKITKPKCHREKLCKSLLYQKCTRKMLMKWTLGCLFILLFSCKNFILKILLIINNLHSVLITLKLYIHKAC